MGLGRSLRRTWNRVTESVRDTARQASGNVDALGNTIAQTPGLDYFINPLIAQDIAGAAFGGSLARGADVRTAFANASGASGDLVSGGSSGQWADLATFNAALVAGAAGGAALTLGTGAAIPGSALAGAGVGTAAGALAMPMAAGADANYSGGRFGQGGNQSNAETPPDLAAMFANDPDTSAQFQRLRKSARMLGRAGTIKYKGSGSSLGLGEQMLGDQMSLIGA